MFFHNLHVVISICRVNIACQCQIFQTSHEIDRYTNLTNPGIWNTITSCNTKYRPQLPWETFSSSLCRILQYQQSPQSVSSWAQVMRSTPLSTMKQFLSNKTFHTRCFATDIQYHLTVYYAKCISTIFVWLRIVFVQTNTDSTGTLSAWETKYVVSATEYGSAVTEGKNTNKTSAINLF